ncbi:C-C chemokine receptor type 8 isoform X1 [Electrophorus electricus]|uniref:G-protein coupled receptors family 1 profile domain-containing protein n=2 Tax=Electrophorus electricus TaxID=8005 RepID=A0AAY5ETK8_ELEEL|nr:C-C chemokine receptor type 8 isoform X1 [Electrophorus electricus]
MEDAGIAESVTTMDTATTEYYYYSNTEPCPTISLLNPSVVSATFYLVFVLGLLGNATVLWVLLKVMRVRSMTDVCLLNLALSDLLTVLFLPFWLHTGAHAICQVMAGVYHLGFYSSILFVTLMSVDRYLAIVHAVAAPGARTLRYGIAASLAVWVISSCAALPEAMFSTMVVEDDSTQCQRSYPEHSARVWKLLRNFGENTVGLFVSLPVMVYCYVRILLVLRRTRNSKRGRAMRLIFAIVVIFVVFWVPYNVVVFLDTLQQLGIDDNCNATVLTKAAMEVTEIITLTHCCVNPVIYAFVGEKFRKCLANMCAKYLLCAKLYHLASIQSKVSENETSNTPL